MAFKTCRTIEKYLLATTGNRVSVVKTSGDKIVFNYVVNGELVTLSCERYYVDFEEQELSGIILQIQGNITLYHKYAIVKSLNNRWMYYCILEQLPNLKYKVVCMNDGGSIYEDLEELDPLYLYTDPIPPVVQATLPTIQQKY